MMVFDMDYGRRIQVFDATSARMTLKKTGKNEYFQLVMTQ